MANAPSHADGRDPPPWALDPPARDVGDRHPELEPAEAGGHERRLPTVGPRAVGGHAEHEAEQQARLRCRSVWDSGSPSSCSSTRSVIFEGLRFHAVAAGGRARAASGFRPSPRGPCDRRAILDRPRAGDARRAASRIARRRSGSTRARVGARGADATGERLPPLVEGRDARRGSPAHCPGRPPGRAAANSSTRCPSRVPGKPRLIVDTRVDRRAASQNSRSGPLPTAVIPARRPRGCRPARDAPHLASSPATGSGMKWTTSCASAGVERFVGVRKGGSLGGRLADVDAWVPLSGWRRRTTATGSTAATEPSPEVGRRARR